LKSFGNFPTWKLGILDFFFGFFLEFWKVLAILETIVTFGTLWEFWKFLEIFEKFWLF